MEGVNVGDRVNGTVKTLPTGAFIDLDGMDGLLRPDMTWGRLGIPASY
jgi:ribosomal protein S1